MVEAGAGLKQILEALMFGHKAIQKIVFSKKLLKKLKKTVNVFVVDALKTSQWFKERLVAAVRG